MLLSISKRIISYLCPAEIGQLSAFALYVVIALIGFGGGLVINYVISKNKYLLQFMAGGRS